MSHAYAVPAKEISALGYRIDGSEVKFWASKSDAVQGARSVALPIQCVTEIYTRFQLGYALQIDGGFLSHQGWRQALKVAGGVYGL